MGNRTKSCSPQKTHHSWINTKSKNNFICSCIICIWTRISWEKLGPSYEKSTRIEYANKIGFIVETYVNLASPTYCINEISKEIELEDGDIDVKKRFAYEKGTRSKALSMHTIESEKKGINEKLSNMKS